ncbi:hypothetical protein [Bowmanella denitrificans]|uniref:hypothetical protein n=1 Tax=Bowmanella denitrificans TaxID=366582 RepID=UPI000C9CE27C|nr:hypothetical protein [Bowmanella denitrificans]
MKQRNTSTASAKGALDTMRSSQQALLEGFVPSVWIRLVMSLSLGAILFGYGMTEHENNWALAIWVGALGFGLSSALYAYTYRLQGIRIRFFPRFYQSEKIHIYTGVGFATLGFGSRFLRTELGMEFGPYLCATAAAVLFFWLQRRFPTGEVGIKGV